MGKAAKITRGGNKKRVNPGRAEAKQKALGVKAHVISAQEALQSRLAHKKKSQAIAAELRNTASSSAGAVRIGAASSSIVRMAPRPPQATAPKGDSHKTPVDRQNEQEG